MNRIDITFRKLKEKNEKALIGFVTAGDPDIQTSLKIIESLIKSGVDIIELGVPFSDPTADGPVIQRSSERSLKKGTSLITVMKMIKEIRKKSEIPIVIFSYYNPILKYGVKKIYRDALKNGADGILIVDLPKEESDELSKEWSGRELSFIRLIAPTTTEKRIDSILKDASGFIYLISVAGVTGSSVYNYSEVKKMIKIIKAKTILPVCVGFGISEPGQVKEVCKFSDGVVVGSAFEKIIENNLKDKKVYNILEKFAKNLKKATKISFK